MLHWAPVARDVEPMGVISNLAAWSFAIFSIALIITFLRHRFFYRKLREQESYGSSDDVGPLAKSLWRTKKGVAIQVYLLGGLGVVLFVQQPVLSYHWVLILGALLISGIWAYLGVKYERGMRALSGMKQKPVAFQALVFFILVFPLSGWPSLILISTAAVVLEGSESAQVMFLDGYNKRGARSRPSCRYQISLRATKDEASQRVCANQLEILGLSQLELRRLGAVKDSNVMLEVVTGESLGVTFVKRVERVGLPRN